MFQPNTTPSQSALNYLNRDSLKPVVPVVVVPVVGVESVVMDPAVAVVAGGKQVTGSYKFKATLI